MNLLKKYYQQTRVVLFVMGCCSVSIACGPTKEIAVKQADILALPKLPATAISLRVAYLDNPRFPTLSPDDLTRLLAKARDITYQHFGLRIEFTEPKRLAIHPYFKAIANRLEAEQLVQIADFRGDKVNWSLIADSLRKNFKQTPATLSEIWQFSSPYLIKQPEGAISEQSLAEALAATMKDRLQYWKDKKGVDGKAILGDGDDQLEASLSEWVYWDNLPRLAFPYEVVITNQPVISAEYTGLVTHTALRGGITLGSTSAGHDNKYGTSSWLSVFAFINDDPMLNRLRDGADYDHLEAIELAGAYLVHELGHQLLHLGHPWRNAFCVMAPARLIDVREWFANLNASKCRLNSTPAMIPGAVKYEIFPPL